MPARPLSAKLITEMRKPFALIIALAGAVCLSANAAEPVNEKCPVSGKAVDPDATAKHTVVIGFCCGKCQAKFEEDPSGEKFAAAINKAAGKPVNALCPVSGEEIDPEKTARHDSKTVGFCCGNCLKKFTADPEKFAAEVKADNPANDKCPLSGKEVDPDTAVAHTQTVGFCCGKCQAKFEKDPGAVLNPEEKEEDA